VAAADVGAYRICFARLLEMLSRALDVVAPRGPTELLAERAWDLGDLWISRLSASGGLSAAWTSDASFDLTCTMVSCQLGRSANIVTSGFLKAAFLG
jgi:hypothetical protein